MLENLGKDHGSFLLFRKAALATVSVSLDQACLAWLALESFFSFSLALSTTHHPLLFSLGPHGRCWIWEKVHQLLCANQQNTKATVARQFISPQDAPGNVCVLFSSLFHFPFLFFALFLLLLRQGGYVAFNSDPPALASQALELQACVFMLG